MSLLFFVHKCVADSTVITLADWSHTAAPLGPRFPFGGDSTLINGLGRFAGATTTADLAVITVTKGKRYRFRLISLSCDPNFTFQIQGHSLSVIEADAVNVNPVTADSIQIFAGQRYSFVLNADQDVGNYWLWAVPNIGTVSVSGGVNSAILRYDGADPVEPDAADPSSSNLLQETSLVPLTDVAAPGTAVVGGVDHALNLDFSFVSFWLITLVIGGGTDSAFQDGTDFFINGATFTSPTVPILLQIMSGAQSAADLLPSGSIFALPANSVVELSFPITATNAPGAPHPFHLHGVRPAPHT